MNIEMALKSGGYILDLDHVKSSLGIFFFLSCLIGSIFHQLSGSTFINRPGVAGAVLQSPPLLIKSVSQCTLWK